MSLAYDSLSPSLGVRENAFGQPVGKALPDWQLREKLPDIALIGRTCRVVPFVSVHSDALYTACAKDDGRMWTYMPYGPFTSAAELAESVAFFQQNRDFQTFTIMADEVPLGYASYMRYDLANGSIEVGGVTFSPALQRSIMATEAMYLMMKHAFDHGYRRYEWKCNQLNFPSSRAALRLGFSFEGVFRNAVVNKGQRRDTAWYSVIVEEWPQIRGRLEAWLDPGNFGADGVQMQALSAIPL